MAKKIALSVMVLLFAAAYSFALEWEFGGILGGGFDAGSPLGTYFDAKSAQLAELGSTTPGSLGTSRAAFFPSFTVGGYAELGLFDWLGLRFEPRVSILGSSFIALTDAGAAFDRYSAYFFGLLLPVYARGSLKLGPGSATVSAGGFYGIALGSVALSDKYVSSMTTAWIPLEAREIEFIGMSGGVGYSLPLGPGIATAEARIDWALTPVPFTTGSQDGELHPLGVTLAVGYGFRIGGAQ